MGKVAKRRLWGCCLNRGYKVVLEKINAADPFEQAKANTRIPRRQINEKERIEEKPQFWCKNGDF